MRSKAAHRVTDPEPTPARPVPALLEEWVGAGLISPDQARVIRDHESRRPARAAPPAPALTAPVGTSLVVEALGYLGGLIMVVGAIILVNIYWLDMSTAVQLLLVGATAVALVAAGFAVPDRFGDAAGRLHSVLWALAVAATATFVTVFAREILGREDEASLIVVGPCTAVVAAVLWWLRPTFLQQLALLVPVIIAAGGLGYELGGLDTPWSSGFSWIFAALWTAVAWLGWLRPRLSGVALGGLVATFSALGIGNDFGILLALATAVALVVVALLERSLPWLAVAAISVLYSAPRAAVEWFPGRLSASLTLIVTGGLLVLAAVWVARHQDDRHQDDRPQDDRHQDDRGPSAPQPGNDAGGRPGGRPPAHA